jgi:hypothetical protein
MTPKAFRRVPLRVTRQLDYPEFSCRPIRAMSLRTRAFVPRMAPCFTVATVPASIAIAGGGR